MHILRKFGPRLGKKGSRPGGSPNSLGNDEHSGKALYFLSFSFIFFHFLSCSFMFFHCFFFPFFFLFLFVLFFSGAQNLFFLPRLPDDSLLKLLCKKSFFLGRLGEYTIVPFFFSLVYFTFFSFSFSFSISFHVFLLLFPFSFFIPLFSFSFPKKKVSSFFILFLFFLFSGAQNVWRHCMIPWGKAHFLCWLYLLCIGSSLLFHVEQCTFW